MTPTLKHGMMIAMAAGALLASACGKSDDKPAAAPRAQSAPAAAAPAAGDPAKAMPAATAGGGEKTAKVHCSGVNACKGQGSCKSAANACAGQNGCKGQSFVDVGSADECTTRGGTVLAGM